MAGLAAARRMPDGCEWSLMAT